MATAAQSARRESRWIELKDFTAGIFADYHDGISTSAAASQLVLQPGKWRNMIAEPGFTYGCVADPDGGLVPLPRRQTVSTGATPPMWDGNAAHYAPTLDGTYFVDAEIQSSLQTADGNARGEAQVMLTVLCKTYFNSGGGAGPWYELTLARAFGLNAILGTVVTTKDILFESTRPNTITSVLLGKEIKGGCVFSHRSTNFAGVIPSPAANAQQGLTFVLHSGFQFAGLAHAAAAIDATETPLTTFDTDVSGNYPSGVVAPGSAVSRVIAFPDPATPNVNSTWVYNTAGLGFFYNSTLGTFHQGRAVIFLSPFYSVGANFGVYGELISYTPPFDVKSIAYTTGAAQTVWGDSDTSAIGAVASVDADTLFVARHGSCQLVRGDLDNPTITNLPQVPGTDGLTYTPAVTPFGVVYGNRRGVFAWNGGTTAQLLSPQLQGFFWDHTAQPVNNGNPSNVEKYDGHRGKLAWWDPYVVVPGDWLYDTRTGSWWRLENWQGAEYCHNIFLPDPTTGGMYAIRYRTKVSTGNTAFIDYYDPAVLARTWVYSGQPLVESLDRYLEVTEIEVVMSTGNNVNTDQSVIVEVQAIRADGSTFTSSTTFSPSGTLAASRLQTIRKDIGSNQVIGKMIGVNIVADGGTTGGGNGNAPRVNAVRLAVRDANMPAKS